MSFFLILRYLLKQNKKRCFSENNYFKHIMTREYKVRLYGIDCPEKSQSYGKKAKQFTADKVFGKMVDVDIIS